MIPNILSIAGVDPSGGAGSLADVKTISALGGYACAVISALTAQNTRRLPALCRSSLRLLASRSTHFCLMCASTPPRSAWSGRHHIEMVADRLVHWRAAPIVLDPVMVAKSGDSLLDKSAVSALREALLPLATIITPNLPEAGVLLGSRAAESLKEMYRAAEKLRALMPNDRDRWVLLKGGHLPGAESTDLLHDGDRMIELEVLASTLGTRMAQAARCLRPSPPCCPFL